MDEVKSVLDAYRIATHTAGGHRSIACLKRSLVQLGVVSSAAVAAGTPQLDGEQAERYDAEFAAVRELSRERVGEPWLTRSEAAESGALT